MVWDQYRHPCILLVHHMPVEGVEGAEGELGLMGQAEHQA